MPSEQNFFLPVREYAVPFHGKQLVGAVLRDGQSYVTLRSLCDAFGLDPRAQRKRLIRQHSLYERYGVTILITTPGGPQKTLCLQAYAVPSFLHGVELERMHDMEARETMRALQEELVGVLAEHFGLSEGGEIRFLRESINRMAIEQENYEDNTARLAKKVEAELAEMRRAHAEKVDQIRAAFADLRQQVTRIEAVAGPKQRLTPEQLGQLRQSVATLGDLLQERGVAKPYPGIYMDITRLTGVSRSEDIRQEDFPAVLAFLEKQIHALTRSPARGSIAQPASEEEAAA